LFAKIKANPLEGHNKIQVRIQNAIPDEGQYKRNQSKIVTLDTKEKRVLNNKKQKGELPEKNGTSTT